MCTYILVYARVQYYTHHGLDTRHVYMKDIICTYSHDHTNVTCKIYGLDYSTTTHIHTHHTYNPTNIHYCDAVRHRYLVEVQ